MTRAVEAELRAEAATEETEQERQRATKADQKCEAAVASAAAHQEDARHREEQLLLELQECGKQRDQAVQVC